MKRCPACSRTYADDSLRFCLEDGTPLIADQSDAPTITTPAAEAPPTVAYGARVPPVIPGSPAGTPRSDATPASPAWTPTPIPKQKRKVWPWVLGAFILLCILGVGLIVVIIGLASLGSDSANSNGSNRVVNSNNSNDASANSSNANRKPAPTNVAITRAYMARDNGNEEPGDEVESFSPSDRTVHVMVELDHAAEGTQVTFDWIVVDAGGLKDRSIKKLDYTTKALESKVHAHLTVPQDWPEGDFKVDIYLNDQLARSIAYKVE